MQGVNPWIEVDGGVSPANAYQLIEVGANALVAGSAVFGAKDYATGGCPACLILRCSSPPAQDGSCRLCMLHAARMAWHEAIRYLCAEELPEDPVLETGR